MWKGQIALCESSRLSCVKEAGCVEWKGQIVLCGKDRVCCVEGAGCVVGKE